MKFIKLGACRFRGISSSLDSRSLVYTGDAAYAHSKQQLEQFEVDRPRFIR